MSDPVKIMRQTESKPQFRIFRAGDAAELHEAMSTEGNSAREFAGLSALMQAGLSDGGVAKVLFQDEAAGMSLTYAWFKAHYPLPRHSHNADCLYYVVSGSVQLGNQLLEAGDGFFVPSDGLYMYQAGADGLEILEFRSATQFDIKFNNSEAAWKRLAGIAAVNRDAWRAQTPPLAARRLPGAG